MIIAVGISTATAEDSENGTLAGTPEKRHNISLFGGGHHAIGEWGTPLTNWTYCNISYDKKKPKKYERELVLLIKGP